MVETPQQATKSIYGAMGETKMNKEKQILKDLKELMVRHNFCMVSNLHGGINIMYIHENEYSRSSADINTSGEIEKYLIEGELS